MMMSGPAPLWMDAVARACRSFWLMRSILTSTPACLPNSAAWASNRVSAAGMKCDHCNRCSRVPCAYAGARRAATMPSTPLAAAPAERARKRRRLTDLFMECLPEPAVGGGRGGILARAPAGTGSARQVASHPALEARVEQVAEPVAHQVDAEHDGEDRKAREQSE